jgi:hypothetical protein
MKLLTSRFFSCSFEALDSGCTRLLEVERISVAVIAASSQGSQGLHLSI